MFKRPPKPGAGFAVMKEDEPIRPKYENPKILLVDLKDDTERVLRNSGFNVRSGTFGTPYRVKKSDSFLPVVPNDDLEDCEEEEIVVLDLVPEKSLDGPTGEKVTPAGEDDWWAKCNLGVIDPRARAAAYVQGNFDRILAFGGIFVVFADFRTSQQLVFGHSNEYNGFKIQNRLTFDNWSFLSVLDLADIRSDNGSEITIEELDDELTRVLKRHMRNAKFTCTITYTHWDVRDRWFPILKNKYGLAVGGIIAPPKGRKGIVLVLPQLENKSAFLLELMSTVLPSFRPELFPHIEGARWVERSQYEIESISALKDEKESIRTEFQEKTKKIEEEMKSEREKHQYLHDLITATDTKLVEAVKSTLTLLGFQQVIDVDRQKEEAGESERDEDLQIHDYSPLLLVEVKGVGGLASDEEALGVAKHIAPRIKQLKRDDISGLSIINHQRHVPALDRENSKPFRDTVLTSAKKKHDVGLLTAWDLFRLARGFLKNHWTHEQVKSVFYHKGRILPIPSHYHFIGTVDEFWEKASALSIGMEDGPLAKGQRIAYELPVDFVEEVVESIQLEGVPIDTAIKNQIVGIRTSLSKENAKKGVRVYRTDEGELKSQSQQNLLI